MVMSEAELPAVIETDRLRLRPPRDADAEAYIETQVDPEIRKFLGGPRADADVRANLDANGLAALAGEGHYVVALKEEDTMVGFVSLDRRSADAPGHVTAERHELELSYVFRRCGWGAGYAAESAGALLAATAGALSDQAVLIITQSANTASLRLAERLGFRKHGVFDEFGAQQTLAVAQLGTYRSPA
jgi:RimJ/RimL family protein N-acetyltransferase